MRGAPVTFADFRASETTRTPVQIVGHIADLLDWALTMAQGKQHWHDSPALPWEQAVRRFHAALQALDAYIASDQPLLSEAGSLFQGPIADALTHVGQLTMLRRIAGSPVRGENYFKANIVTGRVGPDQAAPVREFD
jgi:hypothetical protein